MSTRTLSLLALTVALVSGACKSAKSSSPLSPSIAGPIAGVSITAPRPVTPAAGTAIEVTAQPLNLVLENASSNGVRPLSYLFEVSLDADFANKVLTREGITPGDGRTSFRLPEPLAPERVYYWRARAQDGANTGPFTAPVPFNVFTPVVLQSPTNVSPWGDVRLTTRTATLRITNCARSGPVGSITYQFALSTTETFSNVVALLEQAEQVGGTQVTTAELPYATRYYWRARARESNKGIIGPWSQTSAFQTPLAPAPPPGPGTPPPSGKCPGEGPGLVDCVAAKYPSYLAAGVSSGERRANMEFLRDRVIEEGICAGMQLGWNLKRGGPEVSADYITYFTGGRWIGVDIGAAYDDTSIPLRLQWGENPGDTYATYGGSPSPACR